MALRRLVLLTGPLEAEFIRSRVVPSTYPIAAADSLEALEAALPADDSDTLLLGFCTGVIVPERLLDRVPRLAFNIHPGPPSFPGRHPESWGAYHGVDRFGATLHRMAPRVDEGEIVDVEWMAMAPGSGQLEFGRQALRAAVRLVGRWLVPLLEGKVPAPTAYRWSGHKTSHAEAEAMRHMTPAIAAEEFERRRLAFAEVPGSELTLELYGQSFVRRTPDGGVPPG